MRSENCLIFNHTSNSLIIIALYVDDGIMAGNTINAIEVKFSLNSGYVMKDLGQVRHILGCGVVCNTTTNALFCTQRLHILSAVK